jgi:electron transport complex protein RnfG
MKDYLRLTITLLLFCVIASGILAYVNSLTAPIIYERKQSEEVKTREALIPGAEFTEHKASADSSFVYYVATKDSLVAGYTFIAIGAGYAGPVKTMVGLDKDMKVLAIKVVDQGETPGLGANCTKEDFPARFTGKAEEEMLVDKDGGQIKSLTGATITTRAIANSIRDCIKILKTDLQPEGGAL